MRKKREVFYEKKDVSLQTMLVSAKLDSDISLNKYMISKLNNLVGEEASNILVEAVKADSDEKCMESLSKLDKVEGSSVLVEYDNLFDIILKARKAKKVPITSIMEMYHSGNEYLVEKAKEHIVINYEYFVHDIIHKCYSTVSKEYEKELFQCGVMGLMKAMENYDVNHAAFTTYCIFFVKHEITDQINFYRNDTTVYYNNVQKKIKDAVEKLKKEGFEAKVSNIAILTELKPEIIKRELDYMESIKFLYLDSDEAKDRACEYELTPEAILAKKEKYNSLYNSLDRLPGIIKNVVLMKYDSDKTNMEIANTLGITIGQVKSYYQKGLRLMKKDLELRDSYHDYLSSAEKEMRQYKVNPTKSKEALNEEMDNICALMGDFDNVILKEPAAEQSGLSSLISSFN